MVNLKLFYSYTVRLITLVLIVIGLIGTHELMATERWFPTLIYSSIDYTRYFLALGALMLLYILSRGGIRGTFRILLIGSIIGFITGLTFFSFIFGVPVLPTLRELVKRWMYASSGGTGESALWTEPLFYFVVLNVPFGLIGAILGTIFAARIPWVVKRRKSNAQEIHKNSAI